MEIQELREELLEAISARLPPDSSKEDWHFAFTCEVADRLAQAEEFSNFIPITCAGTGQRGKKLRCDGYERDEADDTLRLVISDFAFSPSRRSVARCAPLLAEWPAASL